MKHWKVVVLVLIVGGAAAFAGFRLSRDTRPAPRAVAGSTLPVSGEASPEIRIKDLEGREHSLTEWRGKILVVNFWATWCPPCVIEIPGFVQLQSELQSQGLQFVGIALDDSAAAGQFAHARGINYPILAGSDNVMHLMEGLGNGIGALPFTVVFDREGHPVHTQQGEWAVRDVRRTLAPLLDPGARSSLPAEIRR